MDKSANAQTTYSMSERGLDLSPSRQADLVWGCITAAKRQEGFVPLLVNAVFPNRTILGGRNLKNGLKNGTADVLWLTVVFPYFFLGCLSAIERSPNLLVVCRSVRTNARLRSWQNCGQSFLYDKKAAVGACKLPCTTDQDYIQADRLRQALQSTSLDNNIT